MSDRGVRFEWGFGSRSPAMTESVARRLARSLPAPSLVGLIGALGAGKTHFVRGFVSGVDAEYEDWVSSPTYAICNEYPCDPSIRHLDLYRLRDFDDLESVGFWDYLSEGWTLVEWPDRIPEVVERADLVVQLDKGDTLEERVITFLAYTELGEHALRALA